jgi:hypothetical protein
MTLEQQVASLVTATTDLTTVVNAELNKVRTENTTFKNGLGNSFSSQSIVSPSIQVEKAGFASLAISNTLKANTVGSCDKYSFLNFKKGESGGLTFDAFSLYSYSSLGFYGAPLIIQDNGSIRLGTSSVAELPVTAFALGSEALYNPPLSYTNIVGLGHQAQVSGANQIQLGNSTTTVYAYGSIQNRSDSRDKADIRPTILGLSFIKSLRPVDFRWDLRDSYRTPAPKIVDPQASEQEKAIYDSEFKKWQEENKFSALVSNGSKKGKRYHHGIIAQELRDSISAAGIDFGGFQDHKISGGDDVLSVGYSEFIAPLIKAVQELSEMNEALNERVKALEAKVA